MFHANLAFNKAEEAGQEVEEAGQEVEVAGQEAEGRTAFEFHSQEHIYPAKGD